MAVIEKPLTEMESKELEQYLDDLEKVPYDDFLLIVLCVLAVFGATCIFMMLCAFAGYLSR